MKSIRASIDANGEVHLHGTIDVSVPCEAILTVIESNDAGSVFDENALLSEAALAKDWDRPEEEDAWRHLRPAVSS